MHRLPVESHSLRSVGFDRETRALEIEFDTGAVYEYADVPEGLYDDLLRAESKGHFFTEHIRPHFSFRRVGEVDLADVAEERREDELLAVPDDVDGPAEAGEDATRHRWVIDVLEDDAAAIEVDGRAVTPVPRWLLPASAVEGDVLRVTHDRGGSRSTLVIELDRSATREMYERSRAQTSRIERGDEGDVRL